MIFGSVFSRFKYIEFTTADEKHIHLENNFLNKIGFKIFGLPHIGLRLRARRVLNILPKRFEKMLDAGCGTGVYSFSLRNRGKEIIGVDIDKQKINYVKDVNRFNNLKFEAGDLRKLKFKKEEFDLIICSDVIEHITEDKKAFSELGRVLKRGGLLKVTVPYDSKSNALDYRRYGHERSGYSEEMLKKMCETNSLRILDITYYSHPFTEKLSKINYKIVDNKILLGILFYPLYGLSILADRFSKGEPNGISISITKD